MLPREQLEGTHGAVLLDRRRTRRARSVETEGGRDASAHGVGCAFDELVEVRLHAAEHLFVAVPDGDCVVGGVGTEIAPVERLAHAGDDLRGERPGQELERRDAERPERDREDTDAQTIEAQSACERVAARQHDDRVVAAV